MVQVHGKERNNQRGSATVEAVVGFTAFLFAIFTILGLVNFCRAQMLVSSAVDTAAKEMSQYAYFYEMSGLQKFENVLDENGQVGKNNINEIIGTVDTLYSSISGAVDQTAQEKTNVENMLSKGEVDLQTFENAVTGIENSAEGVMQGITGVGNALTQVGNDPLLYMRSLVALIGSETMEAAKRAVAVPLAKSFVSKHFGETTTEANAKLESLGIEGGLDSMNFNLSNIFSDDAHQDIEITVIYKVKLLQVFDWVVLEANVSKVAVCRAWLGGDDVIEKASGNDAPPLGTSETTGESEETQDPTDPEETTDPTEETETQEPTTQPVDTTGSYWHLGDGGYGVEHAGVDSAFLQQFYEDYNIDTEKPGWYSQEKVSEGDDVQNIFYHEWAINAEDTLISDSTIISEKQAIKEQQDKGYLPDTVMTLTYVIYVPENISDEEYAKIEEKISEARQLEMYLAMNGGQTDDLADIGVSFEIVRAGGNYDYESGELD